MDILKDFELCGKKQKVPFISIIKQGFIIGEETRRLLGDPAYIRVWRKKDTRQIAINAAEPQDKGAAKIDTQTWQIRGALFRTAAEELMGIQVKGETYRADGTYLPEEQLIVFDMAEYYKSPARHKGKSKVKKISGKGRKGSQK